MDSRNDPPNHPRYCLACDDSHHWYLVEMESMVEFQKLLELSEETGEWDQFSRKFEDSRIDGPHTLSFTHPQIHKL